MPWRLFGFVLIFGVLLAFIGFNLGNTCDISFGFVTVHEAPVYFTVFTAFILGLLCSIPIIVSLRFQKNRPGKEIGGGKKKRGKKGYKTLPEAEAQTSIKDDGTYGID